MKYSIVDAFSHMAQLWPQIEGEPLSVQLQAWEHLHRETYPELLQKQLQEYKEEWKDLALTRIFPHFPNDMEAMKEAHGALLQIIPQQVQRVGEAFTFSLDIVFVLYLGLGLGAGWVTTYAGKKACLLGLENIAQLGWQDRDTLEGLLAHELGHIVHWEMRGAPLPELESCPFHYLYLEGFAQRLEHYLANKETWHEARGQPGWLAWCRNHSSRLAREFLAIPHNKEAIRPYFGSWYTVEGYKQVGYYLGCVVMKELEKQYSLQTLASLSGNEIQEYIQEGLQRVSQKEGM